MPASEQSAAADDRVHHVPCEVVREVAPVGCVDQDEVGPEPGGDPATVVEAEDVGGVDGAGGQCLLGREGELGACERADDREALAECAPGVEVGGERDGRSGVDERARRRHRPREGERGDGQEDGDDVAGGEKRDAVAPGRLEVVDRPRTELDRERYRAHLGQLVPVDAQLEARSPTREQVQAGLLDVERPALDEDIRRNRDPGRLGQHVLDRPVDVLGGVRVLRRDGVRAEPGRDAACRADGLELRELGVAVEPVAALPLERRRAVREHRVAVVRDDRASAAAPAARVARVVERIPPPAARSSS